MQSSRQMLIWLFIMGCLLLTACGNNHNNSQFQSGGSAPVSHSFVYVYYRNGQRHEETLDIGLDQRARGATVLARVVEQCDTTSFKSPTGSYSDVTVSVHVVDPEGVFHEFGVLYLGGQHEEWSAGYQFYGNGYRGGHGYDNDDNRQGVVLAFEHEFLPMIFNDELPIGTMR